jgi:hypothetical protein
MERYRLELVGITYNQIESGVYAVILRQVGGNRRIPIIIGYPEAQAIECKLQEVVTPRPLTHDMMMNFMEEFGIRLKEIEIHRLPSGVFAADMIFTDGTNVHTVDSRSSDAIALAIRAGAPIYTSAEVLEEAGFDPEEQGNHSESHSSNENAPSSEQSQGIAPSQKTIEELKALMQQAAENENYEEAARLKAEINTLENKK